MSRKRIISKKGDTFEIIGGITLYIKEGVKANYAEIFQNDDFIGNFRISRKADVSYTMHEGAIASQIAVSNGVLITITDDDTIVYLTFTDNDSYNDVGVGVEKGRTK